MPPLLAGTSSPFLFTTYFAPLSVTHSPLVTVQVLPSEVRSGKPSISARLCWLRLATKKPPLIGVTSPDALTRSTPLFRVKLPPPVLVKVKVPDKEFERSGSMTRLFAGLTGC